MFAKTLYIDMTDNTTRIAVRGKGVVLCEPTLAAMARRGNELLAVGTDAENLLERGIDGATPVRPLLNGAIIRQGAGEQMLRAFLRRVLGISPLKPELVMLCSSGMSETDRRAFTDVAFRAGARKVRFVPRTLAAAYGADLDASGAEGCFVADIGSVCDAAALALGETAAAVCRPFGCGALDDALIHWLRRGKAVLIIGNRSAQEARKTAGCAIPRESPRSVRVRGRELSSGFPKMLELSSEELREAYAPVLSEIAETVRLALEQASQELYGGIRAEGILLTGEGAGLYGLERYLSEALKLPVHVAADAAECAVLGAAMMRGEKRSKIKVNPGETVTADNS